MGRRATARGWKRWTEAEGRSALAEHAASGMSAAKFCRTKGYSTQRLRYWAQRLPAPRAVSFVPVPLAAAPSGERIEIACDEVVIRVRETLDVAHVARIAVALSVERARRC